MALNELLVGILLGVLLALAIALVVHGLRAPQPYGAKREIAARLVRWLAAALLAASAGWIVIAPRADQPLLDALERAFPAIRTAYMDDGYVATRETRGRARESHRFYIGAAFLILAGALLLVAPAPTRHPGEGRGPS